MGWAGLVGKGKGNSGLGNAHRLVTGGVMPATESGMVFKLGSA
jgi:hypothetical protein